MNRALLFVVLALASASAAVQAQSFAITNARIHTVSGPVIERGTVVIVNGRITAVGANVALPAGAQVIDAAGKTVTPGLLDSSTGLGTVEIGQAVGTNDQASNSDRITAAFNPLDNLNPFSTLIPVTRVEGITRVVVVPGAGASFIAGQGLLMDLGVVGATMNVLRNPVAMYAVLGENGAERTGGTRATNLLRLREVLRDARDFAANRAAFDAGNRRAYALSRLDLEALAPVARAELPLAVTVNRASDILNVLRLGQELNLRLVLQGVGGGLDGRARDCAGARARRDQPAEQSAELRSAGHFLRERRAPACGRRHCRAGQLRRAQLAQPETGRGECGVVRNATRSSAACRHAHARATLGDRRPLRLDRRR